MGALEEKVTAEQNVLLGKQREAAAPASQKISVDDFAKMDLRVGLVMFSARVTDPAEESALLGKQREAAARASQKISVDDFAKVDLRVGLVMFAERVRNSDKL